MAWLAACGGLGTAGAQHAEGCDPTLGAAPVLAQVNAVRAAGADCGPAGRFAPAPPVAWHALLARAALQHSQAMAQSRQLTHQGPDGREGGDRLAALGYDWAVWGENVAAGQPAVAGVLAAWLASPGHCVNLLDPEVHELGLACSVSGGTPWWVLLVGRRR